VLVTKQLIFFNFREGKTTSEIKSFPRFQEAQAKIESSEKSLSVIKLKEAAYLEKNNHISVFVQKMSILGK